MAGGSAVALGLLGLFEGSLYFIRSRVTILVGTLYNTYSMELQMMVVVH